MENNYDLLVASSGLVEINGNAQKHDALEVLFAGLRIFGDLTLPGAQQGGASFY